MLMAENAQEHYRKKTIRFTLCSQERILEIGIASEMMKTCNLSSQFSHRSERNELTADQSENKYSDY